ncbi:MAG: hypothetical protein C5B54_09765 [Acidobacteria bacterium]|nr:MAG: hypothetical protein C5B54_09765 [Acidobacteriota bacterium]
MKNFGFILVSFLFLLSCNQNSSSSKEIPPEPPKPLPQKSEPAPVQTTQAKEQATYRIPPYFENADTAVLTPVLDPQTVPQHAQYAYGLAQRNPKLLAQLPCFCYCDRFGHKSLHDCYTDDHAVHCDICLNETVEANQMESQGMTPAEIRTMIIAKYHPES